MTGSGEASWLERAKDKVASTAAGKRLYRVKRAWERVSQVLGWRAAALHFCLGPVRRFAWEALGLRLDLPIWVQNHWCPAGVYVRAGSTDWRVFRQIFIDGEYEPLCDRIGGATRIVDLGANVGYSAVFFLERYKHASCVCVEPDQRNFEMLLKNTRRYGGRVRCERAAVWSSDGVVRLDDAGFVGKEWGVRVGEGNGSGEEVRAMTVDHLLRKFGWEEVEIMKVDIEGAEKHVFRGSEQEWVGKVVSICAELHDEESEEAFQYLFPSDEYILTTSGELSIAVRKAAQMHK